MEDRMVRKSLRSKLGKPGWALLIYYGIMNVTVVLVALIDAIFQMISMMDQDGFTSSAFEEAFSNSLNGNAWGYFLAAGIGFLFMLIWKGGRFCFGEIWQKGKPMGVGNFLGLLCIMVGGQLVFQIVGTVLELILNIFGLSALTAFESASFEVNTISLFLYAGVLAPVAEEILFRGLILRILMPYGKKFAILSSAILFGLFHGNVVQTPFAFAVGLVLGYAAAEHSILWAMVLHMFNNMILSDLMTRLSSLLPYPASDLLSWAVIIVMSFVGLVVLIVKHRQVMAYLRSEYMGRIYLKCFFTAPGFITLTVIMIANMLMMISPM